VECSNSTRESLMMTVDANGQMLPLFFRLTRKSESLSINSFINVESGFYLVTYLLYISFLSYHNLKYIIKIKKKLSYNINLK